MRKYSILGTLAIAITIGFNGVAQADLNDGLVAYYPFDGNANDMSGNGHHGIKYGNVEYVNRGNEQAISCNNGNFLTLTSYFDKDWGGSNRAEGFSYSHKITNQSNPQTISVWFKTTDYNTSEWGGNIAGISTRTSRIFISSMKDFLFIGYGGDSDYITKELPSLIVNDDLWHHVAIVSNGDIGEKEVYFDGELKLTFTGGYNGNTVKGFYKFCGHTLYQGQYRNNFQGNIDNFKAYNRALSPLEIKELYQKTNSTGCTNNPPLGISNNITMLDDNNTLTLLEKAKVFGANGTEIVKIANTPNATIDSNVERIEFSKNLDNYIFSLTGNILNISNRYGVVANITTSDRLIRLAFKDGSVNFNLTGLDNGIFSEGALTLSNNFEIANIKSILNTNDPSDSTLVNIGSIVSQCAQ